MKKRYIMAFGETKCVSQWCLDERCVVKHPPSLFRRLVWASEQVCDIPFEDLLTVPNIRSAKHIRPLSAFGETKTLAMWLKDERVHKEHTIETLDKLRQRNRHTGQDLLEYRLTQNPKNTDGTHNIRYGTPMEVNGVTKPLKDWIDCGLCSVKRTTVIQRKATHHGNPNITDYDIMTLTTNQLLDKAKKPINVKSSNLTN